MREAVARSGQFGPPWFPSHEGPPLLASVCQLGSPMLPHIQARPAVPPGYNEGMTVRIKICGITTADDAEAVSELGADFIGLNFYCRSPRYINESGAADVLRALPSTVEPVALFVNE